MGGGVLIYLVCDGYEVMLPFLTKFPFLTKSWCNRSMFGFANNELMLF